MKAKDVKCKLCGGIPELHGSDHTGTCEPFNVACTKCGEYTSEWANPREAWAAWKRWHKPSDIQLKAERIDKANRFIAVVAGCGRRFFHHDGRVSYFKVDNRGRIWFVDKYTPQRQIYTHYAGRWKWFSEGGTLRDLVIHLRDFIRTGEKQRLNLGPWPDWICGGDLWGYGDDMSVVRQSAMDFGITA